MYGKHRRDAPLFKVSYICLQEKVRNKLKQKINEKYVRVKSKAVLVPPYSPQWGEDVSLLIHHLGTRWGEWSALHLGRDLPPGKGPPTSIG
jgi:hypothetical protein